MRSKSRPRWSLVPQVFLISFCGVAELLVLLGCAGTTEGFVSRIQGLMMITSTVTGFNVAHLLQVENEKKSRQMFGEASLVDQFDLYSNWSLKLNVSCAPAVTQKRDTPLKSQPFSGACPLRRRFSRFSDFHFLSVHLISFIPDFILRRHVNKRR